MPTSDEVAAAVEVEGSDTETALDAAIEQRENLHRQRIELREMEGELRAARYELERQAGEVSAQRRSLAVSYTHLTLPTKA